jgi:hypothetical protein
MAGCAINMQQQWQPARLGKMAGLCWCQSLLLGGPAWAKCLFVAATATNFEKLAYVEIGVS